MAGKTGSSKKKSGKRTSKQATNASKSDVQWKKTIPRSTLSEFAEKILKITSDGPDAKLAIRVLKGKAAGDEWTVFASRAVWIWARMCFESHSLAEIIEDYERNDKEVSAIKKQVREASNGCSKTSINKKEYETMMLKADITVFDYCCFSYKDLSQLRYLEFMSMDVSSTAENHMVDGALTPKMDTHSRSLQAALDEAQYHATAADCITGRFWQSSPSTLAPEGNKHMYTPLSHNLQEEHCPGTLIVNGVAENSDFEEELEVEDVNPDTLSDEENGVENLRDLVHNLQHTLATTSVLIPAVTDVSPSVHNYVTPAPAELSKAPVNNLLLDTHNCNTKQVQQQGIMSLLNDNAESHGSDTIPAPLPNIDIMEDTLLPGSFTVHDSLLSLCDDAVTVQGDLNSHNNSSSEDGRPQQHSTNMLAPVDSHLHQTIAAKQHSALPDMMDPQPAFTAQLDSLDGQQLGQLRMDNNNEAAHGTNLIQPAVIPYLESDSTPAQPVTMQNFSPPVSHENTLVTRSDVDVFQPSEFAQMDSTSHCLPLLPEDLDIHHITADNTHDTTDIMQKTGQQNDVATSVSNPDQQAVLSPVCHASSQENNTSTEPVVHPLTVAHNSLAAALPIAPNVPLENDNRQQLDATSVLNFCNPPDSSSDVLAQGGYDIHFPCYNEPATVLHRPLQAFFSSAGMTTEGIMHAQNGGAPKGIQGECRCEKELQVSNNEAAKMINAVASTSTAVASSMDNATDLAHGPPTQPNAWKTKSKKIFQNATNGGKLNFIKPNTSLRMKVDLEKAKSKYDVWGWSLLGHYVGYAPNHYMLMNVIRAWGVPAKYTLEEGWIVFRFNTEEDMDKVLMKSPYYIYNKPLIIKKMPDFFAYNRSAIATIPVWVRIYGMAKEFWTEDLLSEAASYVGNPLFKDQVTEQGTKSTYARVMVEVNFSAPITKKITLEYADDSSAEVTFFIENEPIFCVDCLSFGHVDTGCTTKGRNMAHKRFQKGSVGSKDTSTTDIVTSSEGTAPMGAAEESGGISDGVPKKDVTTRDVFSRLEGKGFKLGKNGKKVSFVDPAPKKKSASNSSSNVAPNSQYEKGESSRTRHTHDRGMKIRTRKIWVPKGTKPQATKKTPSLSDGDNNRRQPRKVTASHVNNGADLASINMANGADLRPNNISSLDSTIITSPSIDLQRMDDGSVGAIVVHEQSLGMARIEQMVEQLMQVSLADRDLLMEKYFEAVARRTGEDKEQLLDYFSNEENFEQDTRPSERRRKGKSVVIDSVHSSMGRGGRKKASL